MSFVKKTPTPTVACECQSSHNGATFNLRLEPIANDVREHSGHDEIKQLVNAERLQGTFMPSMLNVKAHEFGDGYHVHPEQPDRVAHLGQLPELLDQHGLTARVSLARGGDHSTVAAVMDKRHIEQVLANGVVDVPVALNKGTFRLHSTKPGRITAVEFVE